jgi:hypothetical protein
VVDGVRPSVWYDQKTLAKQFSVRNPHERRGRLAYFAYPLPCLSHVYSAAQYRPLAGVYRQVLILFDPPL